MDGSFYSGHLLFGLGILAQLLRTIAPQLERGDWGKVLGSVVVGILIGLRAYVGKNGDLAESFIVFHFAFVFSLTVLFRKKILPEIDEVILILWNASFWYLYLGRFGFHGLLGFLALIPSCASLLVGIFRVEPDGLTKILMYVWFLIMSLAITAMLFPIEEVIQNRPLPPTRSFFMGMLFFYAFSYLLSILNFIPIPDKHQSFRERLDQVRDHAYLIAYKLSDFQYPPQFMLAMLSLTALGMYANYSFQLVDEKLLLTVVLSLIPFIGEITDRILERSGSDEAT